LEKSEKLRIAKKARKVELTPSESSLRLEGTEETGESKSDDEVAEEAEMRG